MNNTNQNLEITTENNNSISIAVTNLKKHFTGKNDFNNVKAVDGLSFDVKKGEIFGLLGPNGAGKTTTIKMLTGILSSTEGNVVIGGYDLKTKLNKIKEMIGLCPQEPAIYRFLTGSENIEFFGDLHLMSKKEISENSEKLLKLLGLFEARKRKAKEYSGGMIRQLNLILSIINDPQILFLDEPTVGMDPRIRRTTWEFIKALKEQKITIILTTHYIEETEALCDRVAIIDYGKILELDTPKNLIEKHACKNLEEVFLKITGRKIMEGA